MILTLPKMPQNSELKANRLFFHIELLAFPAFFLLSVFFESPQSDSSMMRTPETIILSKQAIKGEKEIVKYIFRILILFGNQ